MAAIVLEREELDRAKKGDRDSLESIYNKFSKLMRYIAKKYVVGTYTEDDLLSLCHIAFMKSLERFDPDKASFGTYLAIRCKGEILDHFRKEAKHGINSVSLYEVMYHEDNAEVTVEDTIPVDMRLDQGLYCDDILRHVKTAMLPLNKTARKVIKIWFESGCDLNRREVAEVLGVSEGLISVYIKQFTTVLREILVKEGIIMARLSNEQKMAIRQGAREGRKPGELASSLGIKPSTMNYHYYDEIQKMEAEKHVTPVKPHKMQTVRKNDDIVALWQQAAKGTPSIENCSIVNDPPKKKETKIPLLHDGMISISGKITDPDALVEQIGQLLNIAPKNADFSFELIWKKE